MGFTLDFNLQFLLLLTVISGALGQECIFSVTEVNGKNVCKNQIVFEDKFLGNAPLERNWTPEIFFPGSPDYPFVYFDNNPKNLFVENGKLQIKPTILEEEIVTNGSINLVGCTGLGDAQCQKTAHSYLIIPPVRSARITTKETFSFKYGTIIVRAKLPAGDWIVPELWLEPKRNLYGSSGLASGRIRLAMARGNLELKKDNDDIGNNVLEAGVVLSIPNPFPNGTDIFKARTVIRVKDSSWYDDFHDYSLTWTPGQMVFKVDDVAVDLLPEGNEKIHQLVGFADEGAWGKGSSLAPFDQEFYISLGLSVGGNLEFPDGSVSSNGVKKPWQNNRVKAMSSFWRDQENWQNTWNENSVLQVEGVLVKSL